MTETHDQYDGLFRDDDMIEKSPDTKFVSAPVRSNWDTGDQQVLVEYDTGEWKIEAQVWTDDGWYVASRDTLPNPPDGDTEYTNLGEPVSRNFGMFTGLSVPMRLLLAPVYALSFAYYCITGKDVNLQILEE